MESLTLDTIEIDIKDDAGDSISFQHGKMVVKLHFRKQRLRISLDQDEV